LTIDAISFGLGVTPLAPVFVLPDTSGLEPLALPVELAAKPSAEPMPDAPRDCPAPEAVDRFRRAMEMPAEGSKVVPIVIPTPVMSMQEPAAASVPLDGKPVDPGVPLVRSPKRTDAREVESPFAPPPRILVVDESPHVVKYVRTSSESSGVVAGPAQGVAVESTPVQTAPATARVFTKPQTVAPAPVESQTSVVVPTPVSTTPHVELTVVVDSVSKPVSSPEVVASPDPIARPEVISRPEVIPDTSRVAREIPSFPRAQATPSIQPVVASEREPVVVASVQPANVPTAPSVQPVVVPEREPVVVASVQPSSVPAASSVQPAVAPEQEPVVVASVQTASAPAAPSVQPAVAPEREPTVVASVQPASVPATPSVQPAVAPEREPAVVASVQPDSAPATPSVQPAAAPEREPAVVASVQPDSAPATPSVQPALAPEREPVVEASIQPASVPATPNVQQPDRTSDLQTPQTVMRSARTLPLADHDDAPVLQAVDSSVVGVASAPVFAPAAVSSTIEIDPAAASARTSEMAEAANAVAETIRVTPGVARGDGEVVIRLKPTVLDGSEIRLEAKGTSIAVEIRPATPDAARAVERMQEEFAKTLSERIPSFQFSVSVASKPVSARKAADNETD